MELDERTFEDYDPAVEWSHAADADTVTISLPGFKREQLRVQVDNLGHLLVRGDRPVSEGSKKWVRLQLSLKLPDNCVIDGIRSKFSHETLTVTLPKTSPPDGLDPAMDDQEDNEDDKDDDEEEDDEGQNDQGTLVEEKKKPSDRPPPRPISWLMVTVAAVFFVGITAYVVWRKLRSGCATGAGPGELAGAGSYVSEM